MRWLFILLFLASSASAQFPLQPPLRPSSFPLALPTLPASGGYVVNEDGSFNYQRPDAVVLKPGLALTASGKMIRFYSGGGLSRTMPADLVDAHQVGAAVLGLRSSGEVVGRGVLSYNKLVVVPPDQDPNGAGFSFPRWVSVEIDSIIPAQARTGVVAVSGAVDQYTGLPPVFLALKQSGEVISWGPDSATQPAVPESAQEGVVAISGGGEHCLALKANGEVVAWGRLATSVNTTVDDYGGTISEFVYSDAAALLPAEATSGVVSISANALHAIALKEDGSLVQWGGVFMPSLQDKFLTLAPVPTDLISGRTVVQALVSHPDPGMAAVLLDDGKAVVWGHTAIYDTATTATYELPEFQFSRIALGWELYGLTSSALGVLELTSPELLDQLTGTVIQRILAHETNYGLATRSYVDDRYGSAVAQGESNVVSSPSTYGLFTGAAVDESREQGRNEVISDPGAFNLYDETSIMDLNLGGVMLQKSGSTAMVMLQLQTAPSLDQPFVDADEPVPLSVDIPGSKGFLRVRALGPQ